MTASLIAITLAAALQASPADGASRTVIGPDNRFLADGSQALLAGDFIEGVRLTEIGLAFAKTDRERAAALSNLCAGLIRLEHFELALQRCDEALAHNPGSWRAYSNRANVLLNLGRLTEAEASLEAGLAIAPNSRTLLKVLDAARELRYRPSVTITDEN